MLGHFYHLLLFIGDVVLVVGPYFGLWIIYFFLSDDLCCSLLLCPPPFARAIASLMMPPVSGSNPSRNAKSSKYVFLIPEFSAVNY